MNFNRFSAANGSSFMSVTEVSPEGGITALHWCYISDRIGEQYCSQHSNTLGPTNNQFGYNKQPALTSRFLCIEIIAYSVKTSTHF